jgi:hypothetical protein
MSKKSKDALIRLARMFIGMPGKRCVACQKACGLCVRKIEK